MKSGLKNNEHCDFSSMCCGLFGVVFQYARYHQGKKTLKQLKEKP